LAREEAVREAERKKRADIERLERQRTELLTRQKSGDRDHELALANARMITGLAC
jgi:hypothetical protein